MEVTAMSEFLNTLFFVLVGVALYQICKYLIIKLMKSP